MVSGGDALGAAMVAHPLPRLVSFTGSVAAGRQVAAAAGATLKKVVLELGGNDAAILLDDVDPAAQGRRLLMKAFTNSGQACMLIKRLFVPRARYAETVGVLAELVSPGASDRAVGKTDARVFTA